MVNDSRWLLWYLTNVKAFVTQSKSDNKMLHDEVASQLKITTIKSTNIEGDHTSPRVCDISEVTPMGIT